MGVPENHRGNSDPAIPAIPAVNIHEIVQANSTLTPKMDAKLGSSTTALRDIPNLVLVNIEWRRVIKAMRNIVETIRTPGNPINSKSKCLNRKSLE
jgi:hypothetical protein